jgi:ADP-heptose:LPS heptosyltransferase
MNDKDFDCCQFSGERSARIKTNWLRESGLLERPCVFLEDSEPKGERIRRRKAKDAPGRSQEPTQNAPEGVRKILLRNRLCAGDVLVSTAAIESLSAQHPGKFWIGVDAGNNQPIFDHNPHVRQLRRDDPEVRVIDWEYPLIGQSNQRPIHFMDAYTDSLSKALGVPIHTSVNRPYLYLSNEEKSWTNQVKESTGEPTKFWILNAGWKDCFTTKAWLPERYQAVVDNFRGRITFVQIGQSVHNHQRLDGVIDFIDRTDLRQLIRLGWHCEGGIGPSTFLQHLMAAFEKPYVLVDSAREPVSWMAYPAQTSLIRHGQLPCCSVRACWKTRTVALKDEKNGSLCEEPEFGGSVAVPRCSAMISTEDVIRAIEGYYRGGKLTS